MARPTLHVIIRTPQAVVYKGDVSSLRFPTETGQVGLRPRCEATVLAVEPGLVLLRDGPTAYAGTAGGLLHCDGSVASLMTPVAVVGGQLASVLEELDRALSAPGTEKEARNMIERLEKNILQEVQRGGQQQSRSARHEP